MTNLTASAPPEQHPALPQTPTTGSIKIDYYSVKKAALILRALNHKLRQQLLKLIEEEKKITVTEIYVRLRLEQSVASQHLAILRKAGVVSTQRDGKFIFYIINHKRIDEISNFVNELVA
ncbi:metalloregulator ArsR/SmtB family transcription factor [Ferruginibacter paludis]|uniref:ArsR/SmtB family transcription factor n=1 Tax=Ferruginibacter TaxID=1004303 RepID=UPI0025B4C289|nr:MULTISPECIES: metalloregulator ArsR/SmtB family transcription factor [Ferruginibacter]MDB5275059.1 transcriptional regulator, ArsR family [Ferruginibacter sp.]MDN3658501.1 metalloregulator ArsR/SmtB family transcription factor [Ferruginibacter paludis]